MPITESIYYLPGIKLHSVSDIKLYLHVKNIHRNVQIKALIKYIILRFRLSLGIYIMFLFGVTLKEKILIMTV